MREAFAFGPFSGKRAGAMRPQNSNQERSALAETIARAPECKIASMDEAELVTIAGSLRREEGPISLARQCSYESGQEKRSSLHTHSARVGTSKESELNSVFRAAELVSTSVDPWLFLAFENFQFGNRARARGGHVLHPNQASHSVFSCLLI